MVSIIVPLETVFSTVPAFKLAVIPAVNAANVYKIVSVPVPPFKEFCKLFPLKVSAQLVPIEFSIEIIVSVFTAVLLAFFITEVPFVKSISA